MNVNTFDTGSHYNTRNEETIPRASRGEKQVTDMGIRSVSVVPSGTLCTRM